MGSLMASMLNSANALRVMEDGLNVTQNNVTNANTPGYVKQTQTLEAMPFDLTVGLPGGVQAGPVQSSRDAFAEQSVRDQQTAVNYYGQKVTDLTPIESYFSVSSTSGLGPAISNLFDSFSALSINPNDTVTRQQVLNAASEVTQNFQQTANGLASQGTSINQEAKSTIDSINQLASLIAQVNGQNRVDPSGSIDAGVDAQLNSALEQLSQLANYTTLQQPDGSVSVYIGGQTPLVVGDQAYAIEGDFSTDQTAIKSSTGADITAQITGGKLSAMIDDNNNVLPSYITGVNTLAQSLADQVNAALDNGVDENGASPVTDLFNYDATAGAASTLTVSSLTPDQIAAASPDAPGGNANALALAKLGDASAINGYTFEQYYGNLGGQVGNDLSNATDTQATKEQLLNQAQTLRQQVSGVSLDEEAENLMSFQKSYEAVSKMLGVLTSIMDTLMNLLPPATTS